MADSDSETSRLLNQERTASYTQPVNQADPAIVHVPIERHLSIAEIHKAVVLTWKNISVTAPPSTKGLCGSLNCCKQSDTSTEQPKQILRNVNGVATPGTLLAIMGASGAGKTTLMNVLTHRNIQGVNIEGSVLVNGENLGRNITAVSAYVRQEDLLIGTLTVHEHLWFQAMLRMDKQISKHIRKQRVEEVMTELSLNNCANTVIGITGRTKGISGGERKRVGFASELLTNPALLFCDEPTSGLDSFMAHNVVETLREAAARGKTILCTIHQPSSEVYALFDRVLLLAEGRVAYLGPSKGALSFFKEVGYPCPENFNPADFYIQTLAIVPGMETDCRQTVERVCDTFESSTQFDEIQSDINKYSSNSQSDPCEVDFLRNQSKYKSGWFTQFRWVLWRCWLTNARDPMLTRTRLIQTVVSGVLFGLIYLRQDYDQEGVMNINGALFLLQLQMSMGNVFPVVTTFPLEFPIFLKEHHDGMYRVDVYYLCKIIAEAPVFLLMPVILISIVYWMIGMNSDPIAFLKSTGSLILVANVALSFGYIISTSTSNLNVALALAPVLLMPFVLFGGFFVNSKSVPVYFIWLQYISWFNYCNEIMVVTQWQGVHNISCPVPTDDLAISALDGSPSRCFTDGSEVIASMNFNPANIFKDFMVLVGLLVGFRLFAFILLLIRSRRKD